jgi:hypothetical protein
MALIASLTYNNYRAEYQTYLDNLPEDWGKASPFLNYTDIEVDSAFFGAGYAIASFPSLYDMYGKFMAGLDIDALYTQIFESVVNSPVVNELVSAEAALMDDDIEANSYPRLELGSRDLNSSNSSTIIIAKALVEDGKAKALSKFSAQLKYNLIPVAQAVWQTHLEWNKGVVGTYAEIMKFFFASKADMDEINYAMAAKNALWPFTVLDFERAALGALQGATVQKTDVAGASTASKVLSGALSGAAMGSMVGSSIAPATQGAVEAGTGMIAGGSAGGAGYGAVGGAVLGIGAALTY